MVGEGAEGFAEEDGLEFGERIGGEFFGEQVEAVRHSSLLLRSAE